MPENIETLKKELSAKVAEAAKAYLLLALDRFHHETKPGPGSGQALVGSLGIAVELMLKSFLVRLNPSLVFKGLSAEGEAYLAAPADVSKTFNSKPIELDLRDFAYDAVDFKAAVKAFYVFFPDQKQGLRPYLTLFSDLKAQATGSALTTLRENDLAKAVYAALLLAELVTKDGRAGFRHTLGAQDRHFIASFDADRRRGVDSRLKGAREKAKELKVDISFNEAPHAEGWDVLETRCPVCKNWGSLSGTTDIRCEGPKGETESLDFFADSFDCDACGLTLDDVEELKLADMSPVHDRSADLARWHDEARRDED